MTQGAVKTTGKRSRAGEEKKAILSAALDTFSQFQVLRHKAGADRRVGGCFKTNLLWPLLSVKRGVYCRAAADFRYLAGTVKSVS